MHHSITKFASNLSKRMDNEEGNWNLKGKVTAKQPALFGLRSKLREVQLASGNSSASASSTIVEVVELTREGFEAKRKKATFFERNTDMDAQLVKNGAAKTTMH